MTSIEGEKKAQDATRRRRADAERNITTILDAALDCFTTNPQVSVGAIAEAAGIGRVTVYAHFPSRQALLEAVLDRAVDEALAAIDSDAIADAPPNEAMRRLIRSSWSVLERHRVLSALAARELEPDRLRAHHDVVLKRVESLIARGRSDGTFRTDLPRGWMVTTFYSLLHAACEDVNAGRLQRRDVARILERTLLSALGA